MATENVELASKWTERARELNMEEAELVSIRQSLINKGKLKDDMQAVPQVTQSAFKELVQAIQQSAAEAGRAAAAAVAAPAAAARREAAADVELFDDEALKELRTALTQHIAQSAKQADVQAKGQLAVANFLEAMTTAMAAISSQVAKLAGDTETKLTAIEQSMKRPTAPKTTGTGPAPRAEAVPSPNEEVPDLREARAAFDRDLRAEISLQQSAILNAEDISVKKAAQRRMSQLSQVSAIVSTYNGDFGVLRQRYNVKPGAAAAAV